MLLEVHMTFTITLLPNKIYKELTCIENWVHFKNKQIKRVLGLVRGIDRVTYLCDPSSMLSSVRITSSV